MAIRRGPFEISWGNNTIDNVESAEVDYTADEEDIDTLQGRKLTFDGNQKAEATITLVGPDVPALAALLPQHFVATGEEMSTGEAANHPDGAIDIKPRACDEDLVYNDFDIEDCGNPGQTHRIVNARTKLDGVDFSVAVPKYMIKIIGEAVQGEATMQIFTTLGVAS